MPKSQRTLKTKSYVPISRQSKCRCTASPEVKSICDQIAALDPNTPDYNDRKQALKRRLPIIIPHAASFKNGKRVSADAVPSGLAMLDVDHVANPRDWFKSIDKQLLSDNRIYLVAITASGQGLRLIGERLETSPVGSNGIRQFETIEAARRGDKGFGTRQLCCPSFLYPLDIRGRSICRARVFCARHL